MATQGGAFLGNLIVARILGREGYGGFVIISSTVLAVAGVAQLATGVTATKFVAEFAASDPRRAGRVLGLCQLVGVATGLLASLALLIGARPLATNLLHVPALAPQFAITAGYVFFAVATGVLQGALTGLEAFRPLAIASVAQGALNVAFCWWGARNFGLTGAACAMVVSALARWGLWFALLARVCRNRGVPITVRDALKERQVLFGFAIPAALGGFSSMPALWAANAILVRQGKDLAQMAYFGAAMNLKTLILFVPLVIDGVATALLNSERGAGNEQKFRRMFKLNLATTSVVAAALTIGSSVLARPLMALFGSEFVAGAAILRLLAVAACIQALMGPFYQLIQTRGRMWFSLFAVALPRDVLMVVLAFLLTSDYGAMGLAWAQLLAWILAFAVVFAATGGWRREAQ